MLPGQQQKVVTVDDSHTLAHERTAKLSEQIGVTEEGDLLASEGRTQVRDVAEAVQRRLGGR